MIVKFILANFRVNRQSESFNPSFHIFFKKVFEVKFMGIFFFIQLAPFHLKVIPALMFGTAQYVDSILRGIREL